MKGKLNYLVIIGVSIIILLTLVTKAFSFDNLAFWCNDLEDKNVRLFTIKYENNNKSAGKVVGYLQPGLNVTKIPDLSVSDNYALVEIKGDSDSKFLINRDNLECDQPNPNDCQTNLSPI
ncbi:MAG: hypothetical protein F6J98_24410 [Moorea sp. SIO4G2]|nr:hypothetical protein [Moorena sp. SIO4G2]